MRKKPKPLRDRRTDDAGWRDGIAVAPSCEPDAPPLVRAAHALAVEAIDLPTITERLRYVLAAADDDLVHRANRLPDGGTELLAVLLLLVTAIEAGSSCLHASSEELHVLRLGLVGWLGMEGLRRAGLLKYALAADGASLEQVSTFSEDFPPDARERLKTLPPMLHKLYAFILDQPALRDWR
jgi:hypothetical protein